MKSEPALTDVDTDQQENGVETFVKIDRTAPRALGISSRDVDNALYDSFGQRQVATIYDELNQYHVIMEVAPRYRRTPDQFADVYVPAGTARHGIVEGDRCGTRRSAAARATLRRGGPGIGGILWQRSGKRQRQASRPRAHGDGAPAPVGAAPRRPTRR